MIENLQDEFYQLQNKQAKGAKLRANIRWELEGEKCSKTFFKVLERQNLQNQYLSYILMIINQNILAILRAYSNLQKKSMINFTPRRKLPNLLLLNFLAKFLTKKIFNEQWNLCEAKTSLDKIIKSINSEKNNIIFRKQCTYSRILQTLF